MARAMSFRRVYAFKRGQVTVLATLASGYTLRQGRRARARLFFVQLSHGVQCVVRLIFLFCVVTVCPLPLRASPRCRIGAEDGRLPSVNTAHSGMHLAPADWFMREDGGVGGASPDELGETWLDVADKIEVVSRVSFIVIGFCRCGSAAVKGG